MIVGDLKNIQGRCYPAKRRTQNLVGGASPIHCNHFAMGLVTLEPNGGQVPWHRHEEEEVYFVISGRTEMCLGEERWELTSGQIVHIPPGVCHQVTNIGDVSATFIYCYGPAGDVDHWKQELAGTLPKAGIDVPDLPAGAHPQFTDPPEDGPIEL
ncbi:cupin domain-containing protein [Rhodopirellula baltica]|uniref:Protein containing Cupin 2, conserved barrel domain n=1 Tax=Rhodopirellula baltica WH47 TaxID=991778 RepID=F2ALI3_RHOBT|nr:cupin domain-containing protein [Rhodopirellula baltica]EGF29483.1 protein containing Cupin 2, conserved barrel domain [Rhodopirellula baltica WH47]